VAAQNLLGTTASIGQLRGHWRDFRGIKVLCTYHPAYVLRYPPAKRQVWDDIQVLMKEMGLAGGQ
jgi:DNA polymerase